MPLIQKAISLRGKAFVAALIIVGLAGCSENTPQPPPLPSVTVVAVEAKPIPLRFRYSGRVAALREVEIRARVPGILKEKVFIEGAPVKEGDILFRIDPTSYETELARVNAVLREAEAQLARTQRDVERTSTLFERQVGSLKARDDALSAYELAQATVAAAKAQVKTAEINLGYTTIRSPIDGVTSLRVLAEGSLVGTNTGDSLLARVTKLDPAYVFFSFADNEHAEIRRLLESGEATIPDGGRLRVKISFGDGTTYEPEGYVDFTDSNIDIQTGTIRARAIAPNPDSKLRPGQFVRVDVEGLTRKSAIAVPQTAVMQGPQGQFVYVVGEGNKAVIRPVQIGMEVENSWIIETGLNSGDRIVTEGLLKVRPDAPVSPSVAKPNAKAPNAKATRAQ